jgi:hypothetical protein
MSYRETEFDTNMNSFDTREERNEIRRTRSDNLISGMAAACRWGVESDKLMYSSTFGHVSTCVYMSHRPNESFVPEQQRK